MIRATYGDVNKKVCKDLILDRNFRNTNVEIGIWRTAGYKSKGKLLEIEIHIITYCHVSGVSVTNNNGFWIG
jgi:hypothetical protein